MHRQRDPLGSSATACVSRRDALWTGTRLADPVRRNVAERVGWEFGVSRIHSESAQAFQRPLGNARILYLVSRDRRLDGSGDAALTTGQYSPERALKLGLRPAPSLRVEQCLPIWKGQWQSAAAFQ